MSDEEPDELTLSRTAERHLREADEVFDASPAGRLHALDIYAEFSPWIDPTTREGAERLARVLRHPQPLDPRLRPVVALAADTAPDEAVRLGAMLAAVRWSLASDEYACADAAVRRFIGMSRSRAEGVPPSAFAALCDVMMGQGRETEALVVFRRLDETVERGGGVEERIWRARYRCASLLQAEAWDDALAALAECEALWRAGPAPTGYVLTNSLAYSAARAFLGRGELDAARRRLATVDPTALTPTEGPKFLCGVHALAADIELAGGNPDAALVHARTVMHDGGASPGTWCGALTTALEVSDRTGRVAEVNEIVATLTDLLSRPGDRIGTGVSLRLFGRAFAVLEHTPAEPPVEAAARHAALDDLLLRIAELTAHTRREGGASGLPPQDRAVLAHFRRRHAASLGPLHQALAADLADAAGPAQRRIRETVGDLAAWSACASCLQIWNGSDPALPIGHLLGAPLRATLPSAPCPDCARPTAAS